jgi:hypothetical protein
MRNYQAQKEGAEEGFNFSTGDFSDLIDSLINVESEEIAQIKNQREDSFKKKPLEH